jgi:glycosyltransferase involved in cell wall biosynthesis
MLGKVVLVTRQFSGVFGGLERQISEIASELSGFGYEVHLIYLTNTSLPPFFGLNPKVKVHEINGNDPAKRISLKQRLDRQILVYRKLKDLSPGVIISFMTGGFFLSALPAAFLRIPRILAERNSPKMYKLVTTRKQRILIFLFMLLATRITSQFDSYKVGYPRFLRKKIVAVPNAIPRVILQSPLPKKNNLELIHFLFAGRDSFQKRIPLLLDSFTLLAEKRSDVKLTLFTDYQANSCTSKATCELIKKGVINFIPPTPLDNDLITRFDALCIPSIWEGFPNILLESLYSGIPGVGFDECDGVRDLISQGKNGWKALGNPNFKTYSDTLEAACTDLKAGKITPQMCRSSVQIYAPDQVYHKWMALIEETKRS